MANKNCLEGKACPKCGYADEVLVYASQWVSLTDDGTDSMADSVKGIAGDNYDGDSGARCPQCGKTGVFDEWDVVDPVEKTCGNCVHMGEILGIRGNRTGDVCLYPVHSAPSPDGRIAADRRVVHITSPVSYCEKHVLFRTPTPLGVASC